MITKRETRHRATQKGFTLIETILVIIVLSIASYGALTVFVNGLKQSSYPLQGQQALELAKEKLEIILADKHNDTRGYAYLTAANYPNETPISGFAEFNRAVTFLEVDGNDLATASPGSGFKKIAVTVSWGSESLSLVSLATNY